MGNLYSDGDCVEKDYAEAVKWYRKASEQGYSIANWRLSRSYAKGEGVEKDYVEAYALLNLTAKVDPDCAKARDELESKMSTQQVADAEKRTKELRVMIDAKLNRSDR